MVVEKVRRAESRPAKPCSCKSWRRRAGRKWEKALRTDWKTTRESMDECLYAERHLLLDAIAILYSENFECRVEKQE